jgi:hypothetical protein
MKKTLLCTCFVAVFLSGAVFSQSLDDRIRTAVKGLEQPLRYEVIVEAPVIRGTRTATPLSEYLQGEIRHYAANSPGFTVREASRSAAQGRIAGSYIETNGVIRVTLRLVSGVDANAEKASRQFDIPVTELLDLGIDWTTPENIETPKEAEERYTAIIELENELTNTVSLDFDARLNSASSLYFDGDYMSVTITAHQDCYAAIRHIDVHGVSQLIFPNRADGNNFLKKDETRTFFESPTRLRLHEPFGQEQLLITVSTQPFNNLEKEMITPVAAGGFTDALKKTRGATVETLPLSKDERYLTKSLTFSILPFCRSDFEFADPVQALRELADDVRKSGGTFEGDDREGFFVLNNETVHYSVRDKLIALLTRLPPETLSHSAARGVSQPLKIDLTLPRSSIPTQIESTGSKIKDSGGIFTGDTSGGTFAVQKPVEITGNYQVANENITVLITKYPSLFAGTIKSKIKDYFSE